MIQRAIVRPPGSRFREALTTQDLGRPDPALAREQHETYCRALERCGVELIRLPEEESHPDSTFVEDTAVLVNGRAVLARPGAPSRAGEVAAIRPALARFFPAFETIEEPGTLDGGDVCEADDRFLIGISRRTNEEGARQLATILTREGFTTSFVDIRAMEEILHLKSGIGYAGEGRMLAISGLADHPSLRDFEMIAVEAEESYAANALRVNGRLLIATGFPRTLSTLASLGYDVLPLDMSEFQKMDGGLSCLSLRF